MVVSGCSSVSQEKTKYVPEGGCFYSPFEDSEGNKSLICSAYGSKMPEDPLPEAQDEQ